LKSFGEFLENTLSESREKSLLPNGNPSAGTEESPSQSKRVATDRGSGSGQCGSHGEAELRLCNPGAQGRADATRNVRKQGGTLRTGKETAPREILYVEICKS